MNWRPYLLVAWLVSVLNACVGAELKQEAYIWQRAWNPTVCNAVTAHATNFDGVAVLAAEVTWDHQKPKLTRVAVNYPILTNVPVSVVLRIGPFSGPFKETGDVIDFLGNVADSSIQEARARGIEPRELQIDFDCSESNLEGYQVWLQAIQKRAAPTPVTITALPAWLKRQAFIPLAHTATNYVLQVHSLERPTTYSAPFTLCDPMAAKQALATAGNIGVPFRVALPTYGYLLAFGGDGRFIGLSAEGPRKNWPPDAQVREVRTDSEAMAGLVRFWTTNRSAALDGIIWYRFPVADDTLNLHWPTLSTMMAGKSPREHISVETREVDTGLVEVYLANDGETDFSSHLTLLVRWSNARLVAGDGLRDFELSGPKGSTATLTTKPEFSRLPPGEKRLAGWLRFDRKCEVQIELQKD